MDYRFVPPYRVGRKSGRVVLDANGREVATFAQEKLAGEYVKQFNSTKRKCFLHKLLKIK